MEKTKLKIRALEIDLKVNSNIVIIFCLDIKPVTMSAGASAVAARYGLPMK